MPNSTKLLPEILIQIAKEGANLTQTQKHRFEFLRRFCLVCKPWRDPGQEELWRKIAIYPIADHYDVVIDLLISSEGTRRGLKTRELTMHNWSGEEVATTIDALHGIQWLYLSSINQADVEILGKESLLGELASLSAFCAPKSS